MVKVRDTLGAGGLEDKTLWVQWGAPRMQAAIGCMYLGRKGLNQSVEIILVVVCRTDQGIG